MGWLDEALRDEHAALDRALVRVLGLFDRPAPWAAILALKAQEPAIAGLTEPLRAASDGGRLQWVERSRLAGGDALLDSPIGLAGRHVFGCLWAAGPAWSDSEMESLRERLPPDAAPVTRVAPRLVLARVLASSTPAARRALHAVWEVLRPHLFDRPALAPRIWAT